MREDAARIQRAAERRRTWVSEVLRDGHAQSRSPDVTHLSNGERMARVWELLLDCYAWSKFSEDELRLRRSVGRVQRRRR